MPKRRPSTGLGEELRSRVSQNVRRLRLERGLTQASLGDASGIGRSFICLVERGKFGITLDTLAALAAALQTPPSVLLSAPSIPRQLANGSALQPSRKRAQRSSRQRVAEA